MQADSSKLQTANSFLFVSSVGMPEGSQVVKGYDFNEGVDYSKLFASYATMGFQATNIGLAIEEINRMIRWRLSDEPILPEEEENLKDPAVRAQIKCKIFLGYTSNMVSCGMREVIRFLAQHKMIDVIVTTAGGIEEDFIKCLAPTYIGDFHLKGSELRKQGLNRIGNLLVPNSNYCAFEDWMNPILDACLKEQNEQGAKWTPSSLINRLGKEINNPDSIYYWCWKNDIPVYCPAITDGSIGDMIFFHSFKNPGFVLDLVEDVRSIDLNVINAKKSGMIILGGGVIKHHILNANLMRNGADFSVFINTGHDWDGSDAGALPDEAISWGKIKIDAKPVKVFAEASIVFPIIVAETFAKVFHEQKSAKQ
eukprot:GILI01013001.1.p1 GENE.GILI01013001.1~~GILI01013001.1.p1  ORF type:complete len:384 (-),score=91.54 GILI01013001.1:399-1499(-)